MEWMKWFWIVILIPMNYIVSGQAPEGFNNLNTQQINELLQRIEAGSNIQRLIIRSQNLIFHGLELDECPQRLQHIISNDKINCSIVANKLEPQFLSVRIYKAMIKDKQLWDSIMITKNCSKLNGENLKLCQEAKIRRISQKRFQK